HFVENMAARPERGVSRLDLIWDAWAQFAQHPFLGGGLGSFLAMEGTYVHNTAVWFLADFGIVGLAALLGFLGWFLIASWSAYRHAPVDQKPVVLALMMGHALMLGLSMGIEAFYQRHWWLVLALIASSRDRRPASTHANTVLFNGYRLRKVTVGAGTRFRPTRRRHATLHSQWRAALQVIAPHLSADR